MTNSTCGLGARWCAKTDELFGVEGVHVLAVSTRDDGSLVLDVETDRVLAGCAACGVVAVGHGRRVVRLHDTPCFGRPVLVRWRKRIWRCAEESCEVSTWTEDHPYAAKRSKLTTRAIAGRGCVAPRRHHRLRTRPPSRCGLAHRLGWDRA